MNQDDEQLRLLSVFHYVVAAIVGLFALIPVFHLLMGFAMMTGGLASARRDALPMAVVGSLFIGFALVWMTCASVFAACLATAGKFLAERRHYTFCLVTAGVACAFSPFGTALGIFTLLVLLRDGVKAQFAAGAAR